MYKSFSSHHQHSAIFADTGSPVINDIRIFFLMGSTNLSVWHNQKNKWLNKVQ